MYNAIKALNSNSVARIKLNEAYPDWFDTISGVKQGDSLSPTLFGIYINDFAVELTVMILELNSGISRFRFFYLLMILF